MRKKLFLVLALLVAGGTLQLTGCNRSNAENETLTVVPTVTPAEEVRVEYSKVKINENTTYQTWESFGGSGCWWSQYVGGWDKKNNYSEVTPRDDIATLLYDKEKGIGLNVYRFNLGSGSADSGKGNYSDPHRRAQNFESAPGVYDWSKDANAVWFMTKADELMGEDSHVILFCNSPLERLTKTGTAQSSKGTKTNINPDNYEAFANYCLDVAEHFLEQGINVTEISPINEPQWDWTPGNQEGMHLETSYIVGILETFVKEIQKRPALKDVRISAPESGEWKGSTTREYITAIMNSKILREYFDVIDCHSYWSSASDKTGFVIWMNKNYPDVKLRMSEWCEMVNGTDYTMDSAFNMADEIMDDMKILNVISWQYWVLVSPGGYRDGLIHVSEGKQAYKANRRLWALGNFSRFIHEGYERVDISTPFTDIYNLKSVAFKGKNDKGQNELVAVLTNEEDLKTFRLELQTGNKYNHYEVYTTTLDKDLELTSEGTYDDGTVFSVEGQSIVTIRLTEK